MKALKRLIAKLIYRDVIPGKKKVKAVPVTDHDGNTFYRIEWQRDVDICIQLVAKKLYTN